MAKRRVTITPPPYYGNDSQRRRDVEVETARAVRIQQYINERLEETPTYFFYDKIARDLGLTFEDVAYVLKHGPGWGPYGTCL